MNKVLAQLNKELIVSCQALEDEPLHSSFIMSKMAKAAIMSGAKGIRANSIADIELIKQNEDVPVIGIIKRDYLHCLVRITPSMREVEALMASSCDIIALDATLRFRPADSLATLVSAIKNNSDKLIMADCSNIDDVKNAIKLGFDIISPTLVGYTLETKGIKIEDNDFALLQEMLKLTKLSGKFFIAEGNIDTPFKAQRVLELGADSVVVGSAITRPQFITKKFVSKIKEIQ